MLLIFLFSNIFKLHCTKRNKMRRKCSNGDCSHLQSFLFHLKILTFPHLWFSFHLCQLFPAFAFSSFWLSDFGTRLGPLEHSVRFLWLGLHVPGIEAEILIFYFRPFFQSFSIIYHFANGRNLHLIKFTFYLNSAKDSL